MTHIVGANSRHSVVSDEMVILEGCCELDPKNGTSYKWSQVRGATIKLEDVNSARPYFKAPVVPVESVFEFELLLTSWKGEEQVFKHEVVVFPSADIKLHEPLELELEYYPILVPNSRVSLKVNVDNPCGYDINYNFYQTSGTEVILVADGVGKVFFDVPAFKIGRMEFEVTVSDGHSIPTIGKFQFDVEKEIA